MVKLLCVGDDDYDVLFHIDSCTFLCFNPFQAFRMGKYISQFEVGDILRFLSVPIHYAVYIGDGEVVHYSEKKGFTGIIREKLEDYVKR